MCYRKETNRRGEWASRERRVAGWRFIWRREQRSERCWTVWPWRSFETSVYQSTGPFHTGDSTAGAKSPAILSSVWKLTFNDVVLQSPVRLPASNDKRGRVTAILSTRDFTQTVEHVKAFIAYDVSAVAWGLVADVTVARVKGATWRAHPRGLECV